MQKKLLHPNQIITLRDYPLYNQHILRIYFRIFSKNQGEILPPCPVIHKSSGIPLATGKDAKSKKYNSLLDVFLKKILMPNTFFWMGVIKLRRQLYQKN